jgi:hypothetical protein
MKHALRQAFEAEMAAGRRCLEKGRLSQAFLHAERAHVIGQRQVIPHVQSHWLMLRIDLARRSPAEVWGQAVRIVLGALGSAIGVVPIGNTGGADISMFHRLPADPEIARLTDEG